MTALDPDNDDPMYLLGRLWAICEDAIITSGHRLDPGIVAMLGAQPSWALTRLHTRYIHTMKDLTVKKRASVDAAIGEIVEMLVASNLPNGQVSQQDQGRLLLGYWHQRTEIA
jgi:hypothetical protein